MATQDSMSLPSIDNFHIFTTFRFDSRLSKDSTHTSILGGRQSDIYLLEYHYDRLRSAAKPIAGSQPPDCLLHLDGFQQRILDNLRASAEDSEQPIVRRGKVSVWPDGRSEVSLVPVAPSDPLLFPKSFDEHTNPAWTVILDTQPTEASLYTEIKTSHRIDYDRARQDAELTPGSTTEVLLYNSAGEIMDGSITTAYFYRDGKWITPHAGGLEGVTRRFALERGLCSVSHSAVLKESLGDGEIVWLSNAFRGFFPAVFRSP